MTEEAVELTDEFNELLSDYSVGDVEVIAVVPLEHWATYDLTRVRAIATTLLLLREQENSALE